MRPPPHYQVVRVWSRRTTQQETWLVPVLLPHEIEIVRVLRREYSNLATLLCTGMLPIAVEHLDTHLTTLGISGEMLGGATTQLDRCRSTGMTTFSCPGLDGEWRNMCIPLMVMDHGLVMQGSTLDDLLHIVAWSLRFYAMGTFPIARYDGSVWLPSDVWRWKRAGKTMACKVLLCQITDDWTMYEDVFRLPQHNESTGCCFKRCATCTFWEMLRGDRSD